MIESFDMDEALLITMDGLAKGAIPFEPDAACTQIEGQPVTVGELFDQTDDLDSDDLEFAAIMPGEHVNLAKNILEMNNQLADGEEAGLPNTYVQVVARLSRALEIVNQPTT